MDKPTQPISPDPEAQAPDPIEKPGQEVAPAPQNQGNAVRASWRFSADTIRANIAYMAAETQDLLIWQFTWCIDSAHPLRFEELADRIGIGSNTLYKIYAGKYKHPEKNPEKPNYGKLMSPSEKMVKAMRSFKRLEIQRARLGKRRFFVTPSVKRIWWACDQARKSNTPVMLYGSSHIGKTEALKQYSADNNHGKSPLVELEAVNGLKGMLQAIAAKIGVSPNANTPDLIERIKKTLTPDMVLILDEVHLLANTYRKGSFFACMEQLRRIYDATRCGMVFTYTELGFADAERERKRELMQIFRRGVHKVNLGSAPTTEDVHVITEGYGLPWSERHEEIAVTSELTDTPMAVLRLLATEEGLKAITERIRIANDLAADANRDEVTWEDFLRAHYTIVKNAETPVTGWEKKEAA